MVTASSHENRSWTPIHDTSQRLPQAGATLPYPVPRDMRGMILFNGPFPNADEADSRSGEA